ncbi:MAG: hypothetical protein JSW26_12550 [Desulfobacterales bacterium]|nr:MAG: hypothetical protein JSW26_12550 [Desulfobacterales bacterium]
MKVQSTGLGKTVMLAQFKELLNTEFDNQQVLQLTMESTEPLHWTIKVYMEPGDLRKAIVMGLKPSVVWKALLAVAAGRFSLFKKPKSGTEERATETRKQSVESYGGSAEPESGASSSPLSSLKESADSSHPSSPLSKLKG